MSPLVETPRAVPDVEAEIVIVETRASLSASPFRWRPAVNAYRCQDKFVIFVDLAGVPPETVRVEVQPGRLIVRGTRPPPEPDGPASGTCQLLALEIDHGSFERSLELPASVNPSDIATEYRDGLFRIALGLNS